MIKTLIHDPVFLAQRSEAATTEDLQTADDLLDTLTAHRETCVGMAANMIGVCKRIIAFDNEGTYMIMLNPEIIKQSDEYWTEESCLSLLGGPRKIKRYRKIKAQYPDLMERYENPPEHACDMQEGQVLTADENPWMTNHV